MNTRYLYKIKLSSKTKEIYDLVFDQIENLISKDNRSKTTYAEFIEEKEENCVYSATFGLTEDSSFIPTIFWGFDENLPQYTGGDEKNYTEVTIECCNLTGSEKYEMVGEPIHMNFCGLQEYIDSEIVINVDFEKDVYINFSGKSHYYPIIGLVHHK